MPTQTFQFFFPLKNSQFALLQHFLSLDELLLFLLQQVHFRRITASWQVSNYDYVILQFMTPCTGCSNTHPSSEPPLLALFLLFPRLSFSCMRSCVPACSSCSCRLICGCCSKSSTDGRRVPWKQPTEPIGSWLAVFFVLVNERRLREASRWKCWVRPSSEREFARSDRCWSFASTLGCRWRWMVAPVTSSRTADTPATRYLTFRCMTCDWFVPNRIIKRSHYIKRSSRIKDCNQGAAARTGDM